MTFIERTKEGLNIDDSDIQIKPIIEAFGTLVEKNGFDKGMVACGVMPSPDFGYFELADRFWRASLCIYSFGATNCFWERGAGYAEPWLFNVRHSVELYIKGFLLNVIWFEELQSNPHLSVRKEEFTNLRKELGKPHNLFDLYNDYVKRIKKVIKDWNTDEIPEVPEIDDFVLRPALKEMLKELDETDKTSFRFRYPSLKQGDSDSIQKIDWQIDTSKVFPETGLPKEAGYFFDHLSVINHLYELVVELKVIQTYFKGYSEYQAVMNDYWNEYLRQFDNDYYDY